MKSCSRRQLLKTTLFSTALFAVPKPLLAATNPPLYVPPLFETRRGKPIFLNMQNTQTTLLAGKRTEVWGFNGAYLGPTIKIKKGDFAKLNWKNNLPQFVAMNIQGLQASGELMGGIAKNLHKGETWAPIVPITQAPATCWYHACTLASAAYQTYRGLVGLWLIEDKDSAKLGLPQKYGVDDIPLILQDMQLNSEGAQLFQQNQTSLIGDRLFVNGQEAPYLTTPRGLVRLRLLNASLSRAYDIRFDDEREFTLIAQDLGFLPQGKKVNVIHLAPSERAEILVDLNNGEAVSLIAGHKRGFFDKIGNFFSSDGELIDNTILELRPDGLAGAFEQKEKNWHFETDAPATLSAQVQQERRFHIDTTNANINQNRFDPRRLDISAKLDSVERWTLTASSAVGFSVRGAKFIVESINDKPLEAAEIGWKDTVWIDGKVTILVKFKNTSSNNYPFTFGASDLMLADKGCMGLMIVQ
ncbi:multicopper oxidase domain-containing protein [Aggregatibacter actinomycetemcomitans]|uniref:multicopper oxidase domain-containing protein n=1 Tax=Aggregatibacter actinomycetemcomitans TaxID=714 RepID=UPI00023FF9DB|nr:multicopper oxidase domain-containing protein [Aggregatibacter actinomycetemcomitans]EHK91110.1 protein SufI [Aggregatibacter actinomycetemcomitans RhAA1]KNE78141.1 cell division protein FtsQ [Aggregatibacter actinomycetemcomitans RhAA1]